MIDQTPDNQKQPCVRCKERKDPDKFCSPKLSIMYCAEFNIPLPTPIEHTPSQPVALCAACLRTLAKKKNQKRHDRKPKNRLSRNIRTGISKSLRTGKTGLWEWRVGYSLAKLREHLQSQFQPGMSWSNYGQWHIDHIKAVSSFDFNSYDQEAFKNCWSLSNLRPLWARDNWTRKKKVNSGGPPADLPRPGGEPRSRAIALAMSLLLKSVKMSSEEIEAFILKSGGM